MSVLGRNVSKISNKLLKGGDSVYKSMVLDSLDAKNVKIEKLEVVGGLQDLQLYNVEIFDSVIENTIIGGGSPSAGVFTTLQTGNPSGSGYEVCFFGALGYFACWDGVSLWEISGQLSVSQGSDLGNIRIAGNTISSTNTNGDINIDPNGLGTVRIEGPIAQHASIGDILLEVDNGLIDIKSSGNIKLQSTQGTGTFAANDGLNLTTINGDIRLRTEIATTQNITNIRNTGGLLRITTSVANNLNTGDTITLTNTNSNPVVNGQYTVGNLISTTDFLINGNIITDGTVGNLYKELSNSIILDASKNVKIPDGIPLIFGVTCNSITGTSSSMLIKTCGDLKLDVPSANNIYVMNANTKFQFTTAGTTYLTYDSVNAELDITTDKLHITSTTNLFDVTNVRFTDPILTLGGLVPKTIDDNKDRGIEFYYHTGTEARLGWFGYKDSTERFTFIPNATNTNEVISGDPGNFEYNSLYVNEIVITTSSGSINMNCGDILDVKNIKGCEGDLTISGSSNVTIEASNNIRLTTSTISIPNNSIVNFGTNGSSILSNTTNNIVITGGDNIDLKTDLNGTISIPYNTKLTFTGSTNGSSSINSDTSGNLTVLANGNINLSTTGGNIVLYDDTRIHFGPNGTEYITGNTTSGMSIYSGANTIIGARNNLQLQSTTGDIILNIMDVTNTIRTPTNVRLVLGLSGTENSIYTESGGNLIVTGKTSGSIILDNTSSINLYAKDTVRLHDDTKLIFEDDNSSYIKSNNNVFEIVNVVNSTSGITRLTSNTTELYNTGGTLRIENSTTNIKSSNLYSTIGNIQFVGVNTYRVSGNASSEFVTETTNVRHSDPIVTLSYSSQPLISNDNKDRGIDYKYYNTSEKLGWFGWKNTTGNFTFYSDAINTNEVISGTLGSIELGNIYVNGNINYVSGGTLDLSCGDLLNVSDIFGCSGSITIHASNNATISSGSLNLTVQNSINVKANTPMIFGNTSNSISGDTSGIITISALDKVIINSDVQILGTRTEIQSTVTTLVDPVFTLGGSSPLVADDNKDRGIAFHYHTGTQPILGFFGFDDTDYRWKYLVQATNANEVLTGINGDIEINNIYAENLNLSNTTSGGIITGIKQLSGGVITILSTGGNINLTPTQGSSVVLPYNTSVAFGNTNNSISANTSGSISVLGSALSIITTGGIILDSDTSIRIPEGIPLYFGDNPDTTTYIIKNTSNNLSIFNSEGNILLTPSQTINSSTGHIVVPPNNPITFCNYDNRIESDCSTLKLFGFDGIDLTTGVTTIYGDLNVIGTISASSQNIDLNEFILPLGTNQILAITDIRNSTTSGIIEITTNTNHNVIAGDTIIIENTDSVPIVDSTYTVLNVVDADTVRVTSVFLTTNGSTGSFKSNLTTDPGKDVGIQVNWHTGVTVGTVEAKFGFFGFKRDTLNWTFYERGVNTNDVFTGTLGNIELNKAFVNKMSGFTLEGTLNGGSQTIFGSNFNIDGGTIDGTVIGSSIASTGRFTTLTSTIQANVEDLTINSNLNYSLERFTTSSLLPLRNPLVNVIVSFINVSGVSFTSTGNTMANGTVDGQLKKLVIESMGMNCIYKLGFTAGKLIAPDSCIPGTDATMMTFKRKGQSVELLWSDNISAWILSGGTGVLVT